LNVFSRSLIILSFDLLKAPYGYWGVSLTSAKLRAAATDEVRV